ncbi:hypothetical protein K502DRAFT_93759 [Neoconidiobolus thromboides FSU 785]|nr:hypothetical protein K502DRAFT_93759 [Neoconidiobolus thromboides FSU 785]
MSNKLALKEMNTNTNSIDKLLFNFEMNSNTLPIKNKTINNIIAPYLNRINQYYLNQKKDNDLYQSNYNGFDAKENRPDMYIPKEFFIYRNVVNNMYDSNQQFKHQPNLIKEFINIVELNFNEDNNIQSVWKLFSVLINNYMKLQQEINPRYQPKLNFDVTDKKDTVICTYFLSVRKYLEQEFLNTLKKNIKLDNIIEDNEEIDIIKKYVKLKFNHSFYTKNEYNNPYFIWTVVYYLLRSGCYKQSLEYIKKNTNSLDAFDMEIVKTLEAFLKEKNFRISIQQRDKFIKYYNETIRKDIKGVNKYKLMVLRIMGCIDPKRVNSSILNTFEELLWFQFMMCKNNDTQGIKSLWEPYEAFKLIQSIDLIQCYQNTNPLGLIKAYMLSYQFSEVIYSLASYPNYKLHALNLALCCFNYELIKYTETKDNKLSKESNKNETSDNEIDNGLNFITIIKSIILNFNINDFDLPIIYLKFLASFNTLLIKKFIQQLLWQKTLSIKENELEIYFGSWNNINEVTINKKS